MWSIDGSADIVASTVVRRMEGISIDWDGIMCKGKASEGKGTEGESTGNNRPVSVLGDRGGMGKGKEGGEGSTVISVGS